MCCTEYEVEEHKDGKHLRERKTSRSNGCVRDYKAAERNNKSKLF